MLEPLLKQLNQKAFPATWQKILVEVSEIYNDLFQIKTIIAIDVKELKLLNENKLLETRNLGLQLVKYYEQIIKVLEADNDTEKNEQYFRSIINAKFNIAKTLSKMYSIDKKVRVQCLKESWNRYKNVAEFINKNPLKEHFEKELEMTQEMIVMLPSKIDRVNYGQISPFE